MVELSLVDIVDKIFDCEEVENIYRTTGIQSTTLHLEDHEHASMCLIAIALPKRTMTKEERRLFSAPFDLDEKEWSRDVILSLIEPVEDMIYEQTERPTLSVVRKED